MKVIAQRAALQDALALVGSIAASRSPKPVLQCVKLVAEGDVLTLMATDHEVGARYRITAVQIEEPGEVLVSADKLRGIVGESGGDESLTIESDKEACIIRGAGSRFRVFGFDPAEYPAVIDFSGKSDMQIPTTHLAAMIGKVLFSAAKTHSHYAISGVLWEASGNKMQLVATDGHRLAQAKGMLPEAAAREVTAIVPAKLMNMIQRLAADGEEMLEVKFEDNQILVHTARVTLTSSLVQGNFPKYADVIPKDTTITATINAAEFEHRIRQAALLTNEESRGVKLSFDTGAVTLTSRAPETGEAEVRCPIELDGDPMSIGFNPSFLTDVVRVIDSNELRIEMSATNKPAVLKSGDDFLYVLMPIDIS